MNLQYSNNHNQMNKNSQNNQNNQVPQIPANFIRPPFLTHEQVEISPFYSPFASFQHPVNTIPIIVNHSKDFQEFISSANLGKIEGISRYLNKCNYNVNNVDPNYHWTALMHAASLGHYNVIKTLLENGAESNLAQPKEGTTALMLAASNGHTRCIEMLVGAGKADIRIKDINDFSAAYYAIHYGHGSNKIIARLLRIQYSNNNQHSAYNYQNNSLQSIKHHQQHNYSNNSQNNTMMNLSGESSNTNYSNDRYGNNLFAQYQKNQNSNAQKNNSSFNDENEFNQLDSFNLSSDQFNTSANSERRFNTENNSTNLSNSLMSSTNQSLNEILNRNLPKPRPIFKQQQRRISPDVVHPQQLGNELNYISRDFNNNYNNLTMNNKQQSNQQRHSFGNISQSMMNSATSSSNNQNSLRTNSLSLDLNRAYTNSSFNGLLTDVNRTENSFQQKGLNYSNYDNCSVFESPLSAKSDFHQSFNEKNKFESGYFNFNKSLNESLTEENDNLIKSRNKPRNSTFSNTNEINCSNISSIATSRRTSTLNSPIHREFLSQPSSIEELDIQEFKYTDLATNLDEFLNQNGLQDEQLNELFMKQNIHLYKFLSMSETDLKQIGITNPEHLATLIAGQLKFKEQIGIKSLESMNFIIYLGSHLDKAKKKINLLKNELETIKKENHLLKSLDNMRIYEKNEKSD